MPSEEYNDFKAIQHDMEWLEDTSVVVYADEQGKLTAKAVVRYCSICKGESGGELLPNVTWCDACEQRAAMSEAHALRLLDGQQWRQMPCWEQRRLVWVSGFGDYMQLRAFAAALESGSQMVYTDPSAAAPAADEPPNTA